MKVWRPPEASKRGCHCELSPKTRPKNRARTSASRGNRSPIPTVPPRQTATQHRTSQAAGRHGFCGRRSCTAASKATHPEASSANHTSTNGEHCLSTATEPVTKPRPYRDDNKTPTAKTPNQRRALSEQSHRTHDKAPAATNPSTKHRTHQPPKPPPTNPTSSHASQAMIECQTCRHTTRTEIMPSDATHRPEDKSVHSV